MSRAFNSVAVLGAGKLARAFIAITAARELEVRLWARRADARRELAQSFPNVTACDSVAAACGDAAVVAICVPAPALVEVAGAYGPAARGDQLVLHASRGVGEGFLLPHQAIRQETCVRKIGVLGGPLYFEDLGPERPLVAVLGSRYDEAIAMARELVAGTPVRLHPTHDVIGVEVAGAVSNVSALAAGMAEALGLGDTAIGVLLTRGLAEASRIGLALGAEAKTFSGLAGVGDLIPRPVTSTRRHREVGASIAGGTPPPQALGSAAGCVEGAITAREAAALGARIGLELPLMSAVDAVLSGNQEAGRALASVLKLDLELGS